MEIGKWVKLNTAIEEWADKLEGRNLLTLRLLDEGSSFENTIVQVSTEDAVARSKKKRFPFFQKVGIRKGA